MKYYSAIKNNDFMKFAGKQMELENIILSEVTKEHTQYVLTEQWILAQKFGIPKIQFTYHMKPKKNWKSFYLKTQLYHCSAYIQKMLQHITRTHGPLCL